MTGGSAPSAHPDARDGLRRLLILAGGAGIILLAAVGALIVREHIAWVANGDAGVERAAHRAVRSSSLLLTFARDAAHAGDTLTRLIIAAVIVGYLAVRRLWRLALFAIVAIGGGLGVVNLVKILVDRTRPALPDPVAHAAGASFPSGHSMGSTIVYGVIVLLLLPALSPLGRWLTVTAATLVIAAVSVSRVLLGLHFTSDVLAGVLFGVGWLCVSVGACQTWRQGLRKQPLTATAEEGVVPEEQARLTPS